MIHVLQQGVMRTATLATMNGKEPLVQRQFCLLGGRGVFCSAKGKCVPLYLECVFVSHSLTILFADAFLLFLHMLLVRALYANYYIDFCIIKFFFISTTMAIECQRKLSPRSLPSSGTAKLSYSRQQMRADIIDKGVATNTEATINIKPTNLSAWDQYDSG